MDKLDEIMEWKRKEIAPKIRPVSNHELNQLGKRLQGKTSFLDVLANPEELSVIAEIKRKSPSAGMIAENASAVEQARAYVNAKADALSVLTDDKFFGGQMEDLWEVNDFLTQHQRSTPTIRKDFMIEPIQVLEAVEAGSQAILLIVRALSDDELKRLRECADHANIDCLYEIHTEAELEKAILHNPRIIGVNNRDLARFVTDLSVTEELFPLTPAEIIKVSESGILCPEDAWRVRDVGADAVLGGEALMRAEDTESFIQEMKDEE